VTSQPGMPWANMRPYRDIARRWQWSATTAHDLRPTIAARDTPAATAEPTVLLDERSASTAGPGPRAGGCRCCPVPCTSAMPDDPTGGPTRRVQAAHFVPWLGRASSGSALTQAGSRPTPSPCRPRAAALPGRVPSRAAIPVFSLPCAALTHGDGMTALRLDSD
jgi:hypothetical protein